jgi:predicted GNAT family acetyltransferase
MSDEVVHEPENHRYVLRCGDRQLGEAAYELRDGVIDFTHTVIDPAVEERGLGTILVSGALDDVRASSDRTVIATCPFVKHFVGTHAAYQDLLSRRPTAG